MKYYCWIILLLLVKHEILAQVSAIDSLSNICKNHQKDDTTKVRLLNQIARCYYYDNSDTTLYLSKKSLAIAEKIHFMSGKSDAFYNIGLAFSNQNQYAKAIDYYFKSLELEEKMKNNKKLWSIANEIALTYENMDDFGKSLEFLLKALKYAEISNDKLGIGIQLGNIAENHYKNDQYPKALEYFSKSIAIAREIGDSEGIAYNSFYIGQINIKQNNINGSIQYVDTALTIYQKLNLPFWIIQCKVSKATIYRKRKKYNECISILEDALKQSLTYRDKQPLIDCQMELAESYLESGNLDKASFYAGMSNKLATSIGRTEDIGKSHALFSAIFEKKGIYDSALIHYKKSEVIKDSLFSVKRTTIIKSLLQNYELDKKQQEIASQRVEIENKTLQSNIFLLGLISAGLILSLLSFLIWQTIRKNRTLHEQKEEIGRHNQALLELNHTKDTLFSIISHDLRAPIASLQSTLYLLQLGILSEAELEKVSQELSYKVTDTTNLLNNLLYWAKSQMDGIKLFPEKGNVESIIKEIVSLLSHQTESKKIQVSLDFEKTQSFYADIPSVSMILRNLLSNAVKFTPRGGSVSVNTSTSSTMLQIHVHDTGLGISEEDLKKLFSPLTHFTTQGTSQEVGTGLGLLLCKDFAERNNGSISVESTEGKGSIFSLSLPLFGVGNITSNN
jgi:signal transduction histidine kinase